MDYLFSIHPVHVEKILNGTKSVELRNRRVNLVTPARIWIYATSPIKSIVAFAKIENVTTSHPSKVWSMFRGQTGITRSIYNSYVGGRDIVSAIELSAVVRLDVPIKLPSIRRQIPKFHPPQFYLNLSLNEDLCELLNVTK